MKESSEKGTDQVPKERMMYKGVSSTWKRFGALGSGVEHLGGIWSNKGSLLCHLIKGWPKRDALAP